MLYDIEILQSYSDAVKAAVAASSLPSLPIKFVGVGGFDPPADQIWLEQIFIPNNPDGDFIDDCRNYVGMFRLILHTPNDTSGPHERLTLLRSIAAYFTKGRMLGNVQICSDIKLMQPLEQGKEIIYPCSVRYNCFRSS